MKSFREYYEENPNEDEALYSELAINLHDKWKKMKDVSQMATLARQAAKDFLPSFTDSLDNFVEKVSELKEDHDPIAPNGKLFVEHFLESFFKLAKQHKLPVANKKTKKG